MSIGKLKYSAISFNNLYRLNGSDCGIYFSILASVFMLFE